MNTNSNTPITSSDFASDTFNGIPVRTMAVEVDFMGMGFSSLQALKEYAQSLLQTIRLLEQEMEANPANESLRHVRNSLAWQFDRCIVAYHYKRTGHYRLDGQYARAIIGK